MNIVELQELLDRYGSAPEAWPQALRVAAERLVATEPAAGSLLERAQRLDAAIEASVRPVEAEGARILAALAARPLPRQRNSRWRWPAALLNVDFAPAWPRLAALAGVAALGFVLGLVGLDLADGSMSTVAATSDAGLSVAALEPETLTGVRP
jgi:hypothetical protein